MKDLTVLLAHKNRRQNLEYCLSSIAHSAPTVPNVVLVDFGSTRPLDDLNNMYPWLSIINVTRNTAEFHKARALNIGIKHIKTKYICTTDVDQIFADDFFHRVHAALRGGKTLVMCKTHELKKQIPEWFVPPVTADIYKKLLKTIPKRKLRGEGCCLGFTTNWAMRVHGWDERYKGYGAEDSDLMLRAMLSGLTRVWITKQTSLIHLPHEKKTKYYSNKNFTRNKNMYLRRKKIDKDISVNTNKDWGML